MKDRYLYCVGWMGKHILILDLEKESDDWSMIEITSFLFDGIYRSFVCSVDDKLLIFGKRADKHRILTYNNREIELL